MLMSSIIFLSMDLELSKSACSGQISSGKLAGSQMRTIGLLKKKMYSLPSSKKLNRAAAAHANIWEMEAGETGVTDWPQLHSEFKSLLGRGRPNKQETEQRKPTVCFTFYLLDARERQVS